VLETLLQLLLYSLPPALVMMIAGLFGAGIEISPSVRSAILHFAGGVIIAVVGVELIPPILEVDDPTATAIGFAAGAVVMLLIRFLIPEGDQEGEGSGSGVPKAMIFGTGVDLIIDGLIIGIGLAAGGKQGLLISLALSFEALTLGLATSATLIKRGLSRFAAIGITAGLGSLFVVGAVVGGIPLQGLQGAALDGVLAFGCAALLFLAAEELISEAHEAAPDTPWMTGSFLLGFLVILLFDLS